MSHLEEVSDAMGVEEVSALIAWPARDNRHRILALATARKGGSTVGGVDG